jgi:DNA-binding NarL/FixJ family response regulator
VLRLAARGKQHGEISRSLGIAVNTVKNHFRHIYEKLGVGSLTEALIKLNAGRGLLDGR